MGLSRKRSLLISSDDGAEMVLPGISDESRGGPNLGPPAEQEYNSIPRHQSEQRPN